MITDRFSYHKIKSCNHGMIKGFILALFIHGILFFIGGKYFVTPVQYSVQSDYGSIDVDLLTAVSQSDTESAQSITSARKKPQEKPEAPAQPSVVTVQSSTPTTEKQQEPVKIMPQEEQVTLPQSNIDTAKSITSTIQKQQETANAMPRPSLGTIRTKSKPGYFRNQPPEYPQLARQMSQEGLVILRVEIDKKGIPVQVEVEQSSGYPLLDQAALKAVKRWRFQPERIGDSPVKSVVAIPVRFRLEDSERRSH